MVQAYPFVGRLQGLLVWKFTGLLLRNPIPQKPQLMQYKTRVREASCAGNGQKMSRRDLSEVFFEKSTLKGKKIVLAVFLSFVQFGGS